MKPFKMSRAMYAGTVMLRFMLNIGLPMGPLQLLTHRGRKSGKIYTTPVALVQQDGTRWLVSAFGEVNWIKNIRAAGSAQLGSGRRAEIVEFVELEILEAAPILKQFLKSYSFVPFIPPYFDVTSESSIVEFECEAIHHPVFRIVPSHTS
jgi:deazaflavin-dependent oxidoreductase (nitroreductase family)